MVSHIYQLVHQIHHPEIRWASDASESNAHISWADIGRFRLRGIMGVDRLGHRDTNLPFQKLVDGSVLRVLSLATAESVEDGRQSSAIRRYSKGSGSRDIIDPAQFLLDYTTPREVLCLLVNILQRHLYPVCVSSSEFCVEASASKGGIQSRRTADHLCDALYGYLCGRKGYHPGTPADYDAPFLFRHA